MQPTRATRKGKGDSVPIIAFSSYHCLFIFYSMRSCFQACFFGLVTPMAHELYPVERSGLALPQMYVVWAVKHCSSPGGLPVVVPETGRSFRAGMWFATSDARQRRNSTTTLQRRKNISLSCQPPCSELPSCYRHIQSQQIESNNGPLERALSCTWAVVGASSASPVLGREKKGCKPEVGYDEVGW